MPLQDVRRLATSLGNGNHDVGELFKKSTDKIIEAFAQLGTTQTIPSEVEIALEQFVCQLYLSGTDLCELSSVRWHIFKKSCAESEKLSPTKGALVEHIKRAHYQAMVWYHDKVAKPDIPEPYDYGWTVANSRYIPVRTLNSQQPLNQMIVMMNFMIICKIVFCITLTLR